MLTASNLSKSYGDRALFEDVSFSLSAQERLGLVGRNGSGKSTLFRIILGEESPDQGTIVTPRGYRIGHLSQHLRFTEPTILREACLGLPLDERDQEYRGEIILAGLGFADSDMQRAPAEFSGGFQIRLNLAKLLLSEPNLLLLDEPTNYLDIVSMRWLTSFLRNWKGELMLISHDRLFMDSVTTHTMFIHRGRIRKVQGDTTKLYAQVAQEEEIYEKTRVNEDKKRRDLEVFITRFRAQASKAALVQSKMKALERMGEKGELSAEESLDFRFCEAEFPGKTMVELQNLSFGYPDSPTLIEDFNIRIGSRDRIGIIGKNGKGKSTLLRLLNGELSASQGQVNLNQNARIGYFGQTNIARLSPDLTVEQEIQSANTRLHRTTVRGICGTMMFSGDDALKKIKVLSGGEKSRVLLGRILALPTNFLLLDEPTNHLDMESIGALIESMRSYNGAVVIVTHSELILRELATRLIVFRDEVPYVFEHDYDYFLKKIGWEEETIGMSSQSARKKSSNRPHPESPNKKEKDERSLQRKISACEERIHRLELELREVETKIAQASEAREIQTITELSTRMAALKNSIEEEFQTLEKLSKANFSVP